MKKRIEPINFLDEELIRKAAEGGQRLQDIQMIVWDYMRESRDKRDGIEMAMKIAKLFEKDAVDFHDEITNAATCFALRNPKWRDEGFIQYLIHFLRAKI